MSQTENVVKLVYALQRRYGNILEQIDENNFIKLFSSNFVAKEVGRVGKSVFVILTPPLSLI